jgi:hypothetical protein
LQRFPVFSGRLFKNRDDKIGTHLGTEGTARARFHIRYLCHGITGTVDPVAEPDDLFGACIRTEGAALASFFSEFDFSHFVSLPG